jgi:hypothetical protein
METANTSCARTALAEIPAPAKDQNATILPENTKASASKKSSSKSKPKYKAKKKPAVTKAPGQSVTPQKQIAPEQLQDKGLIETREEMQDRLKHGTEYNRGRIAGVMIAGTVENPNIQTKIITFPEDEI